MSDSDHARFGTLPAETIIDQKFRLEELLGEGGAGKVYRATNLMLDRQVAIKVLRAEFESNPDIVERFLSEARSANKVRHPNVIDVMDVGLTLHGTPYIVQELLVGETLASYLARKEKLSCIATLERLFPIVAAVAFAHSKGLIHRDIKPENIFLSRQGNQIIPKIVDFGISKVLIANPSVHVTQTGIVMGTPTYMPPEQFNMFHKADARADVWALGVILYECLAGMAPFKSEVGAELLQEIHTTRPDALTSIARDVTPELDAIVMRCLEKSPSSRFNDAGELSKALQAFIMTREDLWSLLERDISFPATRSVIPEIRTGQAGDYVAPTTGVRTQQEAPIIEFSDDDHSWATVASETPSQNSEASSMRPRRKNFNSRRGVILSPSSRPLRRIVPSETPTENEDEPPKVDSAAITVTPTSRDVANVPVAPHSASPPQASRSYVGILTVVALAALGAAIYANVSHTPPSSTLPSPSAVTVAPTQTPVSLVRFALTSNVDGAEAVFRGRTYPVPFEIEVEPRATEDTVRVTASGYVSRQFTVILDQSIRLTASLAAEVPSAPSSPSAPSPPAPTPVVVSPVTAWVPTPARVTDAGATGLAMADARRMDVPQTQIAAHVAPPPTSTTVTPPVPQPSRSPASVQVAEPVAPPSVTTAAPADVSSTAPAPSTAVAVVTPPRVVESPAPRGPDVASIQREIRAHRASVSNCVDRERAENPMLSGRITLRIRITTQGLVSSANVQGESSPSLSNCLERDAISWMFAPTNMEQTMEINVPIDLD
jgi:serine/threonine protein kinase